MLLCANMLIVAGLLLSGYSGIINPTHYPYLSLIGFAFPAFLLATVGFIALWVCIRVRYALVSVLGLMLAYGPVRTYCPINFTGDAEEEWYASEVSEETDGSANDSPDGSPHAYPNASPHGSIKVLSYNILGFNFKDAPADAPNPIIEYLSSCDADIMCLQEWPAYMQQSLLEELFSRYEYRDTIHSDGYERGSDVVAILSKYPVIHKEHIYAMTKANSWGAFDVLIGSDTVHIVNTHLQTVGMSEEQKAKFGKIVKGKTGRSEVSSGSKMIVRKLASSAAIRAGQADAIEAYLRRHSGERIILCGDFNDHPLSYVHRTIGSRLTDCYEEAGMWTGYTYKYNSMYVRIDNIMCSKHFQPTFCAVDKSITLSDHYPIYCILKPKNSQE